MSPPIYLDYNGTTPHDPEVVDAMRPYLEAEFGNPSSSHWYGAGPARAVDEARRRTAAALHCDPTEIIFTSGGTESNNHAIKGIARAMRDKGNHIITSEFEHPAVLEVCRHLAAHGFETTHLPVDREGMVRPADLESAIRPETILISIMHANNEVGTIQPIAEFSEIAKKHGIAMHTDAAQSIGKTPVDVQAMGVDLLSAAGHKVYAPKGIGALYIRGDRILETFCHGAGQENGRRAGTENVLQIVGLGKACQIAARDLDKNMAHMKKLRDRLHEGLSLAPVETKLNGHPDKRLPNTLNLSFKGIPSNRLLQEIGRDVAASPGAACHSDGVEPSHVLKAMGLPLEWAKGALRFSVGRMTTMDQIEKTVQVVVDAVKKIH